MDMHARMARDKLVLLGISFRMRDRIIDNPALDTQAGVWAMEENRGHTILSARASELLLI